MKEYIDREATLNERPEGRNPGQVGKEEYNKGWNDCRSAFYKCITSMPSADVVEVRHAKWKYFHKQNKAVCTNCSFERDLDAEFGRAIACPNCAARMDKEVET